MSEMTNKVTTKHEIKGSVQITKVYPELENLTVTPTKEIQSFKHLDSYGYDNVVVKAIDCETLNITPKQESQSFDGMYDKVNVDAIVGDTLNIKPTAKPQTFNGLYETVNVEKVQGSTLRVTPKEAGQSFDGLYETVNVEAVITEEVEIDPDFSTQDTVEVTATEGKYIKKVTVNKDENLVPENILEGEVVCGIEGTGRNGIDTSDADATAADILKDKTAYVNGEKITGTLEAGGDYNATMNGNLVAGTSTSSNIFKLVKEIPVGITVSGTSLAYAFNGCSNLQTIPEIDTSSITDMKYMFQNCTKLTTIPQLDTSSVKDMQYMFGSCTALTTIPQLDTSSVTTMYRMFTSCSKLTNTCLNTILQMCINTTAYTSTKTLKAIGLSSTLITRCQSLSNYQAFLDAGWTTG